MWTYTGQRRPEFAQTPGPGEESVWDYPRPPAIVADSREVVVKNGDQELARTQRAVRILETASPPAFYIPPEDVSQDVLVPVSDSSLCEWKGRAAYWGLASNPKVVVAWTYPEPKPDFQSIRGYVAFYPGRVECYVDGERVRPQPGMFYGGWVTDEIIGPFKGEPGTGGW